MVFSTISIMRCSFKSLLINLYLQILILNCNNIKEQANTQYELDNFDQKII